MRKIEISTKFNWNTYYHSNHDKNLIGIKKTYLIGNPKFCIPSFERNLLNCNQISKSSNEQGIEIKLK